MNMDLWILILFMVKPTCEHIIGLTLVQQTHEELGHFGIRRTQSMFRGQYWWTDMYQQVVVYIMKCEVCHRVRSSFNTLWPQLQPWPTMGLTYHWSLEFAGLLVVIPCGAKYMVMVEHFIKWTEFVALPQNSIGLAVELCVGTFWNTRKNFDRPKDGVFLVFLRICALKLL